MLVHMISDTALKASILAYPYAAYLQAFKRNFLGSQVFQEGLGCWGFFDSFFLFGWLRIFTAWSFLLHEVQSFIQVNTTEMASIKT